MAYQSKDLSALGYANGFTLWHYRTADLAAVVDDTGYFNAAGRILRVGDFILINAGLGGTPTHGVAVVVANAAGTVETAGVTNFGRGARAKCSDELTAQPPILQDAEPAPIMTPTLIRRADELLRRLDQIKAMRSNLPEASEYGVWMLRSIAGSQLQTQIKLDRPAVADLLDREADECRRALTDLGVELGPAP